MTEIIYGEVHSQPKHVYCAFLHADTRITNKTVKSNRNSRKPSIVSSTSLKAYPRCNKRQKNVNKRVYYEKNNKRY